MASVVLNQIADREIIVAAAGEGMKHRLGAVRREREYDSASLAEDAACVPAISGGAVQSAAPAYDQSATAVLLYDSFLPPWRHYPRFAKL